MCLITVRGCALKHFSTHKLDVSRLFKEIRYIDIITTVARVVIEMVHFLDT
jgi:hypothetical protein